MSIEENKNYKEFKNQNYKNLGFGLGLRQKHVDQIILKKPKDIDWFEIISENYFNPRSKSRKDVEVLRQDYPFVMHGVSLSIGSTDPLDMEYMKQLKNLERWLQPELVSDHICWTGINNFNSHDLLPVPYTEESLQNMIVKICQVQDYLGRQIALENPSTYLEFKQSNIPEWDFINTLAHESDCLLLMDINNIYVNCFNHNYDPQKYINSFSHERIAQIHLAGHKNYGTHIIDTHSDHIADEVLELYKFAISKFGNRSTMIEWDSNIPSLGTMFSELKKVKQASESAYKNNHYAKIEKFRNKKTEKLSSLYNKFQSYLLKPHDLEFEPENWIKQKDNLSEVDQIKIYASAYRTRLFDLIVNEYNASKKYLSKENFAKLVRSYIEYQPSKFRNIDEYIYNFPKFAKKYVDEISYELLYLESEISLFQEILPDLNSATKTLEFNNDVNLIYSACMNDGLSNLTLSQIEGKKITLEIGVDEDGVYRSKISA